MFNFKVDYRKNMVLDFIHCIFCITMTALYLKDGSTTVVWSLVAMYFWTNWWKWWNLFKDHEISHVLIQEYVHQSESVLFIYPYHINYYVLCELNMFHLPSYTDPRFQDTHWDFGHGWKCSLRLCSWGFEGGPFHPVLNCYNKLLRTSATCYL